MDSVKTGKRYIFPVTSKLGTNDLSLKSFQCEHRGTRSDVTFGSINSEMYILTKAFVMQCQCLLVIVDGKNALSVYIFGISILHTLSKHTS